MPTIFIDGKYLEVPPQTLQAFTPGIIKAHGVFETLRVCDGKAEYIEEHLVRLYQGLKVLKIRTSYSSSQIKSIVRKIIFQQTRSLNRLRIMVWREKNRTHCAVMAQPYTPPTKDQYRRGLTACLIQTKRPATARTANLKSLDYELFSTALKQAHETGYEEAILINAKGHVFETSRSNIFIYHKGQWITPPLSSGCLNGIMRQQVLKQAKTLNVKIQEKNITPAMLKSSKGGFFTNSLMGIILFRNP